MAIRDTNNAKKNTNLIPLLLLSFLCFFSSLFFFFSAIKGSTNISFSFEDLEFKNTEDKPKLCEFSNGTWIYDPSFRSTRYDNNCKDIFKGWNCISNNKSNAQDIIKWRWQPNDCDLSRFDPIRFLERFRNTNIGFVGDSLNRNMFVSLVCTLKQVSNEVKKWRPAGADRGYTFLHYNLTVAYHRTNLLAHYGRWSANTNGGVLESLGYKQGFRVDVDVPENTWEEAPSFHDILILNTGHWWWAPSKFDPIKSPMIFFEKGLPVIPPMRPDLGLDMVLKHMVGQIFSLESNGTNVEARLVNLHLYKALKGSSFHILDVTHMSEFRADAHPSTAGGKKHDDCMHWCLPGITDTWNDLLVSYLNDI